MLERFAQNERIRLEAIGGQTVVGANEDLAREIDRRGELMAIPKGTTFIEQNGEDNCESACNIDPAFGVIGVQN